MSLVEVGPRGEMEEKRDGPVGQNGEDEDVVKVILLGDSAVGKSKLIERFLMVSIMGWWVEEGAG